MRRIFILSLLSILSCELFAQQNVFHRSDAGTNNWWDGSNPWYRECDGWWINRPDRSECNNGTTIGPNNIFIGHNNNTAMNVNGALFQVRAFTLQATATSARTFNDGGEISLSVGIYNESTGNHVFNVPIHVDAATVDFQANSGNLSFTTDFILNANVAAITGSNNITISGVMSGVNGGISKSGTGSLFLTNTNTYTGSTTISAGTLELQGSIASSAVTVSGGTLRINGDNVTVASLTVEAGGTVEIEVGKSLTVSGAFSNSGTFTIKSDATGTGSLITNGTESGDVTIQRYVSGDWSTNNSGWHLISSPVAVQPIVDFTTTGGGNGYDFYGYNEATNTWMNYKAAGFEAWNESANFFTGRGYSISYQATQTGKAFEGTLNNSNVTHTNLSLTAGQGEGWHLVGNPFASAIDWSNVNWVKTGFNAYAKVWQGSSYKDVTDDYSNIIPSANGFWVKASNATNTLTIPTQARTHNALNWLKSSAPIGYIILTANDTENNMSQECIIRVKDEATDGFDESFDAPFMAGNAPHIYTTVENRNLSMNSVPSYSNKTFEMGFVKNSASAFTIQLNMDNIPEEEVITLTDKKLNQSFELTKGLAYEFISEAGDDPNRFLLHFGAVGVDEAIPATAVAAYVSNNILYVLNAQGKVQVDVMDISGRLVHSQSLQANGLSSTPLKLPAGVYVVRLNDGQTTNTNKVIVQ